MRVYNFKDLLFFSQWYPGRRWERAAKLWFVACYLWGKQQFWSSSFMGIILLVRLFFPVLWRPWELLGVCCVGCADLKVGDGAWKWDVIQRDQKGHSSQQTAVGENRGEKNKILVIESQTCLLKVIANKKTNINFICIFISFVYMVSYVFRYWIVVSVIESLT